MFFSFFLHIVVFILHKFICIIDVQFGVVCQNHTLRYPWTLDYSFLMFHIFIYDKAIYGLNFLHIQKLLLHSLSQNTFRTMLPRNTIDRLPALRHFFHNLVAKVDILGIWLAVFRNLLGPVSLDFLTFSLYMFYLSPSILHSDGLTLHFLVTFDRVLILK